MKPGYKTTEFWLAAVAQLIGLVLASGIIAPESSWDRIAGLATAALATMGYSAARSTVKSAAGRRDCNRQMTAIIAALLPVLELLLKTLLPVVLEKINATQTAQDARPADAALRQYLRRRVRSAEAGQPEDGPGPSR